ncbi:MAG: hypothetical protein N838_25265 [Thiohalocapsa sp. PB-PSB1]|jgi:hypothetical protein|nr:MAG: hypothetical protein N838_25265 [Thiohalocapsa sp. PB-PSB1]
MKTRKIDRRTGMRGIGTTTPAAFEWLLRQGRALTVAFIALALTWPTLAVAKNHYIVLFDASGSVYKQHAKVDNLWQGMTGNNRAMAEIMRQFIDKVLTETPSPIPTYDPTADEISVLLFRVDFDYPSYRQHDLFLTNDILLKSWILPTTEAYLSFTQTDVQGTPVGEIQLKDAFGGHSPLVAATAASLPFLGEAFQHGGLPQSDVDNTYIVRITDGDFNSDANASDEHRVIQKRSKTTAADDGFDQHAALSRQVNKVFDIGAESIDCVLPTHEVRSVFTQPFDCRPDAYKKVSGWGKGFLISYLSVEPKVPALSGLARTEQKRVTLDVLYRRGNTDDAGVRLVGNNPIFATGFDDPNGLYRLIPDQMEWSEDGARWIPCQSPARDSDRVDCGQGGPELDYPEGQVPSQLRYRVHFVMEFPGNTNTPSLYPYRHRLGARDLARVALIQPEPSFSYFNTDSADIAGGLPSPKWMFPDNGAGFEERPIDTAELERLAEAWEPDLRKRAEQDQRDPDIVTAKHIARLSREKKDAIEDNQSELRLHAWLLYLTLAGVIIFGPILFWLLWPRRRLDVQMKDLASDGLLIDFNDTQTQRAELIGMLLLKNTRSNPSYTAEFRHIEATLNTGTLRPSDQAEGTAADIEPRFADPRRDDAPLAIGGPSNNAYSERKVASGKELPLFFNPREIVDLEQIAGVEHARLTIPAKVHIGAGRAGERTLKHHWDVELIPERTHLCQKCMDLRADDDGHPFIPVEYQAGAVSRFASYQLTSSAMHRYSYTVRGLLGVDVHDAQGKTKSGAVELVHRDDRDSQLELYLRHKEPMLVDLHLDFRKLSNPIERDNYRIVIFYSEPVEDAPPKDADLPLPVPAARDKPRWQKIDEWRLEVQRSAERTDVSVVILYTETQRSKALNEARNSLSAPFPIGSRQRPISVHRHVQEGMRQHDLFKVRLGNACRNGHGHADWQARIRVTHRHNIQLEPGALNLLDGRGEPRAAGTLRDSPVLEERQLDLSATLDLELVIITGRDFRLEIEVEVDWQVHAKDPRDKNAVKRFQTSAQAICLLRHEPPRHVLAIDFGTSAMAVAHAIGPQNIELLPLPKRLDAIEKETKIDRRWDDPGKRNPYFLASELNVCNDRDKLARTRPDSPDFLDLPLILSALTNDPDTCFSSLKALISAGYTVLPIDARKHPYTNLADQPENLSSPPLDAVIEGAYHGLVQHFIAPILEQQNTGYSHVYITHPNTYTQNHVEQLRKVVEQVFSGMAQGENIVYPDNIHFISESDAVAYYYLMHAHDLRTSGSVVPDRERILVYDIGAGTLDLTYLEVDWIRNDAGGRTPKRIRVLRRGGVTKAGDLLDECIARDLHAYLDANLGDRYLTRIVVKDEGETMSVAESTRMDELRQQIHQLKADLSAGKKPRLELTSKYATAAQLVKTKAEETRGMYRSIAEIDATESGKVFWTPRSERILDGAYASAFIDRVTRVEVERFLGKDLQQPDTVILSGRTSLWPGFRERLAKTLGDIPNWVDFNAEADSLKRVVVLGVVEREYRWRNIEIESPKTAGVFGVRYEPRAEQWDFLAYPESGKRVEFFLQDASEVQIGLETNNGFTSCFNLLPDLFYAGDCKLTIQLDFDETGYLKAEVTNTAGRTWRLTGRQSIPTLSYHRRPWPLGAAKLCAQSQADLLDDKGESK